LTISNDHGPIMLSTIFDMKEIAISEFKAKCLALLEQVHKTKKSIRVTRFGKPIAEVVPPSPEAAPADWIGSMRDTMEILGDIVSPASDERDWEVLRD
jgi:prevent-host-death family protein